MADFIDINVDTSLDAQKLADNAIDALKIKWPGWEPNDGDLEVVLIETIASMAADLGDVLVRVPQSIFRYFGTNLKGLPYQAGSRATSTLLITAIDTDGYLVPAGSEFSIDGFAFRTIANADISPGDISVNNVLVEAVEIGSSYNDLTGTNVTPLSALAFVTAVSLNTPTSGGADEETDEAYQDRLSRRQLLSAETLVTNRDYELLALDNPGVARAIAQNDGERNVLVVGTDQDGEPLSTGVKDALSALYDGYRQVNTVVTVDDATYTTVNVDWSVKKYPGYDSTTVEASVNSVLESALSPITYGVPKVFGDGLVPVWYNDPRVRKNKMIDLIGDVEGVDYVEDVDLSATGLTPETNGDLILPGTVVLPHPGTMTGTVTP